MNPLPLTDPTGRVLAYACGRCLHVGASGERLVVLPANLDKIAADYSESSRLAAKKCCLCWDCKAPLMWQDRGYQRYGRCLPCDKAERRASRLRLIRELTRPRLRRALAAIARLRGVPMKPRRWVHARFAEGAGADCCGRAVPLADGRYACPTCGAVAFACAATQTPRGGAPCVLPAGHGDDHETAAGLHWAGGWNARLREAPLHVVGGVVQPPGAPVSGGSLYVDAAGRVTAAATGGRGEP